MSIDLVALVKILLLMRSSAVLLSVLMIVCGYGWPRSLSVLRMRTPVLVFKNNAPSYASAADEITLRIIVDRLRTVPLLGVFPSSFDRKWWPPARLHAFFWTGKMHRNGFPVPHHWH